MEDGESGLLYFDPSPSHSRDPISPVILALDPETMLGKMVDALDVNGAYTAFMSFFDDVPYATP